MILIKYFILNLIILINILLIPKYQIFILLANWKKVWIFHNYFLIKYFYFIFGPCRFVFIQPI